MAYVEVDVDLDEFDTADLIFEFKERRKRFGRKGLKEDDAKEIADACREFLQMVGNNHLSLPVKTLDDEMKIEILERWWGNITAAELERRLG